ncbi:10589_t:CDS:2, partial [Entrophospora sp. SA101]
SAVVLNEQLIKEKGWSFANLLGIDEDDFHFSNGWIQKFKKRNQLVSYKFHGEGASAPIETLPEEQRKLQEDKSRITVLLGVNSTGTEKLQPLVIGYSKRPGCFVTINISRLPVIYKYNSKAWMHSDIWVSWLKHINEEFQNKNRQVSLLVDNARIIKSFKAKYKHLYCSHVLRQFESGVDIEKSKLNLKQAIDYVDQSWSGVTTTTIKNCWGKTWWPKFTNEFNEYIIAIDEPLVTEDTLSDIEIVEMVLEDAQIEAGANVDSDEDNEEPPPPMVTIKEAYES